MLAVSLLCSIFVRVAATLINGGLSKKLFKNSVDRYFYQMLEAALCFLVLVLVNRGIDASGYTVFLSALMGLCGASYSIAIYFALRNGPVSITTMITGSLGMLIGTLVGPVFFGESISRLQIIGILLAMISMFLLTGENLTLQTSLVWIVAMVAAAFGDGFSVFVQKALSTSAYAGETKGFISCSFFFNMLTSLLTYLFLSKGRQMKRTYQMTVKAGSVFAVMAMLELFLNVNNLKLVMALPTVIFVPSYSIGGLLLSVAASVVLFREHLTKRQILGVISGLSALILISGLIA